jgi:hypothetical protein
MLVWFGLGLLVPFVTAKDLDPSKLPPAVDKPGVTFQKDIKPVFDRACRDCHGAQKAKGGIRLDSLDGILKGGHDGKVVVPGQSAKSLLAYAAARTQAKSMPPKDKGQPLTPEQVGLIRAWIDQGAK